MKQCNLQISIVNLSMINWYVSCGLHAAGFVFVESLEFAATRWFPRQLNGRHLGLVKSHHPFSHFDTSAEDVPVRQCSQSSQQLFVLSSLSRWIVVLIAMPRSDKFCRVFTYKQTMYCAYIPSFDIFCALGSSVICHPILEANLDPLQ